MNGNRPRNQQRKENEICKIGAKIVSENRKVRIDILTNSGDYEKYAGNGKQNDFLFVYSRCHHLTLLLSIWLQKTDYNYNVFISRFQSFFDDTIVLAFVIPIPYQPRIKPTYWPKHLLGFSHKIFSHKIPIIIKYLLYYTFFLAICQDSIIFMTIFIDFEFISLSAYNKIWLNLWETTLKQ